jgi:HK97 family phage major capsid protein
VKTLRELRDKFRQLNDEAAALIDGAVGETDQETRALNDEETKRYKSLTAQLDELGAEIDRRAKIEPAQEGMRPQSESRGRPGYHPTQTTRDDANSLFVRYIRQKHGTSDPYLQVEYQDAVANEFRASNDTDMNITTAADGGDLVPVGHYNNIIARRDEAALDTRIGVMDIPGVGTTVNVPVDNEADGEFVATNEAAVFDRDAPAVAKVAMTLVKYTKKLELSYELLQDEASRLLPFIEGWVGRGMARTQNNLLVTEVLANGTAGKTFASPTLLAASDIPDLVYALQEEYEDGAVWLMRRATQGKIFGLSSASDWQFAPKEGGTDRSSPRTLWAFPAYATQYMPATVASAKSLVFGNFSFVGRRLAPAITFLRDPYTLAHLGQVRFLYHFRTVYKVLQSEAIVYGTQST